MSVADKFGWGAKRAVRVNEDGQYEVRVQPPEWVGGPTRVVKLTQDQHVRYQQWRAGEGLIQDMLHDLSANERAILQSGAPI